MDSAISLENAHGFARWILDDVAISQTSAGEKLKRGRRRNRGGKRIARMYSRGILKRDTWGLCWRENEAPGRGNDLSWRLTLAVKVLQEAGKTFKSACSIVGEVAEGNGYLGKSKRRRHIVHQRSSPQDVVKGLVCSYCKRWDRIGMKGEVKFWLDIYLSTLTSPLERLICSYIEVRHNSRRENNVWSLPFLLGWLLEVAAMYLEEYRFIYKARQLYRKAYKLLLRMDIEDKEIGLRLIRRLAKLKRNQRCNERLGVIRKDERLVLTVRQVL
jgi:hypothetical protein